MITTCTLVIIFVYDLDLPVTEMKATDKIVPAVIIVSVILLTVVTIITAIVIIPLLCFVYIRKKHNQKGNKEQDTDTNGQLQLENEDKKDFEATCSEAKEIIPISIGLTAMDEDKSVDDNNN